MRTRILLAATAIALFAVASALGADSVYWGNYGGNKVSFVALDATAAGDVVTAGATMNAPLGVALDPAAGRIYWANAFANKISYANLNGSGGGDLSTTGATVTSPVGVAVDPVAGRIYWANYGGTKISFANLNGSGGADLNTTGATVSVPAGVAVDPAAGRIYWANAGAGISYANLNGSGGGDLTTTGATVNQPYGVAVDPAAGRIYWANLIGDKISYANLNGSGGADLTTTGATVSTPWGVALDPAAGRIYWANWTKNKISFANLNGSGGGDLPTLTATVNGPTFPALLKSPSGTGAPAISGGSTVGSPLSCSQGSWEADLLPAFLYRAPQSFAYQWARNGSDIGGATSSSLTPSSPGSYTCRVTATNHAGSASQTSAAHSVLATLTVAKAGAGSGTVTSSPAGIDCGATCSAQFGEGGGVALSESATAGSTFSGWSGDCSGTGGCSLAMNADKNVTATFVPACVVPKVKGKKLAAAKSAITRAHCSVGRIKKAFSSRVKKRRVISQKPKPRAQLAPGAKVALVVSKGRKP